jgi:hypothetical protein
MIINGVDTMKWANMIDGRSSIEEIRRVQALRIADMKRRQAGQRKHAAWKALPFWRRWFVLEPRYWAEQ